MTDEEVLSPELEDRLRRGLVLLAEETPAPGAARRKKMHRLQAATLGAAAALAVVLAGPALVDGLGSSGDRNDVASEAAGPMADAPAQVDTFAGSATGGDDMAAKSAADGDAAREESAGAPLDAAQMPPEPQMSAENYGRNQEPTAGGRMMAYDLPMLVGQSQRIVVGKVSKVTQAQASDASGGLPYVLATLEVEDTLRGPSEARVVAFDYSYDENSIAAGGPQGAAFAVGERVLVFLSDTTGTVHHGITPQHWQVTGGSQGKFTMNGPEPEAPFTLDTVRAEIERQSR